MFRSAIVCSCGPTNVLYSPSRDILLAVVSFRPQQTTVTDSHTSSTASTITQQEVATVEVRNGSGRAGIAKAVAELVKIGSGFYCPEMRLQISRRRSLKSAGKEFPQTIKKLKELCGPRGGGAATGRSVNDCQHSCHCRRKRSPVELLVFVDPPLYTKSYATTF